MKRNITNEKCPKRKEGGHLMYYEYTYLYDLDSGFVTNILRCSCCGKRAQSSTMYEPSVLLGKISMGELKFKEDTIRRDIKGGGN